MEFVVGADVWKGSWVAAAANDDGVLWVRPFQRFEELLAAGREAAVIGVDIPIGLPARPPRRCDVEARAELGARRASLFFTPSRRVLAAADYASARRIAAAHDGRGVSAQSYALRTKVFEVEPHAETDDRLFEVHPELAFAAMNGTALAHPKTSWNGLTSRRRLLADAGLELPDDLGAGAAVAPPDVLDAVAVSWTARRIAHGIATRLPRTGPGPFIWA